MADYALATFWTANYELAQQMIAISESEALLNKLSAPSNGEIVVMVSRQIRCLPLLDFSQLQTRLDKM